LPNEALELRSNSNANGFIVRNTTRAWLISKRAASSRRALNNVTCATYFFELAYISPLSNNEAAHCAASFISSKD